MAADMALHIGNTRGVASAATCPALVRVLQSGAWQRQFCDPARVAHRTALYGERIELLVGPAGAIASDVESNDHSIVRGRHGSSREAALIAFRWRVVQEVLETAPRSRDRGTELRRAARKWSLSLRTVQRWVGCHEASGGDVNSFRRQRPANGSVRRVWISRIFDRAYLNSASCDPALLPRLRAHVDQLIRAAWASPAQRAGWQQVRREVLTAFSRHLRELGIELPPSVVAVSQRRVREAQHFRIVDVRAHDRKRYDDQRPRITRRNDLLVPMQQIVMDVKVIDCVVTRPDGTTAWPRMVAYMDTGTQRIFRRFFLLAPSEGIRQEHVAETFLAMVSDPAWGFPQQLYRDNGSEFFILDLIRSALDELQDQKVPTIINARPYSAASKPIESKFAVLDRFVFSQMQGWAGGDRMRKKTANLGMSTVPYKRSFEEFVREADERISIFEGTPIGSGAFAGKSPRQLFAEHVSNEWRPLLVNLKRLDAAFCTRETRRVSKGRVKIGGAEYRHPELITGQSLTVALPWRRGSLPLAYLPERGWVTLLQDIAFGPMDLGGARESNRRQREHDAATRRLKSQAGHIDLDTNHRDRLAAVSDRPAVRPIFDGNVLPNEEALGCALARPAGEAASCELRMRIKRDAETKELERYFASRRT